MFSIQPLPQDLFFSTSETELPKNGAGQAQFRARPDVSQGELVRVTDRV